MKTMKFWPGRYRELHFERTKKTTSKRNNHVPKRKSQELPDRVERSTKWDKIMDPDKRANQEKNETGKSKVAKAPEKNILCEFECGFATNTMSKLKYHIEETHTEATIPCPECDKLYPSDRLLKYHKRKVHDPKKFKCDQCDKKKGISFFFLADFCR